MEGLLLPAVQSGRPNAAECRGGRALLVEDHPPAGEDMCRLRTLVVGLQTHAEGTLLPHVAARYPQATITAAEGTTTVVDGMSQRAAAAVHRGGAPRPAVALQARGVAETLFIRTVRSCV